jgi:hypothetical protein
MIRLVSVMAAMAAAVSGCAMDMKPYVWPAPTYGVPYTQTYFTVRYSSWWNTPDEIREVAARYCGPGYDVARLFLNPGQGTAIHSDTVQVSCGTSPQPMPLFRGQDAGVSYLISLKPPADPSAAPAAP